MSMLFLSFLGLSFNNYEHQLTAYIYIISPLQLPTCALTNSSLFGYHTCRMRWYGIWGICCEVLCICLCVTTCVFSFRKYVFAGNWSPQRPVGVWSLHIHKVRPTAAEPTVTFLQASAVMLITGWISAGGDVPVKRRVTYRRHVSRCRAV